MTAASTHQPPVTPPLGPPAGAELIRVRWLPGSDRLVGTCHCGAETVAEDPVALWEWLLAHPDHADQPDQPDQPASADG